MTIKLPRLHQAILKDDLSFLEKEGQNPVYAFERDNLGFNAKELALLLGKMQLSRVLGWHGPSQILVDGKGMPLQEFEKEFQIKYVPTITFSDYDALLRGLRETPYLFRFSTTMKRRGIFYKEDIFKGVFQECNVRYIDAVIGCGLFAEKEVYEGAYVGNYAGRVVNWDKPLDTDTTYLLHYPTSFFSMHLHVIDAGKTGNLSRFINHSDYPNLRPEYIIDRGLLHIVLFANQTILPGDQLTVDYGRDYWMQRKQKNL